MRFCIKYKTTILNEMKTRALIRFDWYSPSHREGELTVVESVYRARKVSWRDAKSSECPPYLREAGVSWCS